jgi:hypothetical protein
MAQIRVCYKCKDREIGCHAVCEKYILESEKNEKIKENISAMKKTIDDVYLSRTSRKRRRCC